MSLFKNIDPSKRYGLVDTVDGRQLFTFHVHNEDPLEIFIDSGPSKDSRILIDSSIPFKSPRFSLREVGVYLVQPTKSSVKTAAYRAQTAAERIEQEIRTRMESERLKAMPPANEGEGVVHVGAVEENVGEISTAVFWGVTGYPDNKTKKKVVDAIYLVFFMMQHTSPESAGNVRNQEATFRSSFEIRKARLIKSLKSKGIDPSKLDFDAPWTDFRFYQDISNRYADARREFSESARVAAGGAAAAAAPPNENNLSSGSSLENIPRNLFEEERGGRRRTKRRRHTKKRRTRR